MNRKIKIGISILLLIIMIGVHVSYAISNQNEKDFFKVNKEEISPEETLEMTFDISSLKYNKFKILLKSNVDSEDIYTENQENISIDNDENAISIDVDKEKISLNQIKLYYQIPKEMTIGTKIQFIAQIIVNNEKNQTQDNTVTNELEIDNNTQNSENENTNQEEIAEEITKTITVVEKKIEDDKNNENKEQSGEKNKNQNNNEQDNESKMNNTEKNGFNQEQTNNQNQKTSSSNMNNQKMSSSTNIGSSSGENNENQATYNGSNNNYLSELEIDGIELNTSFNKENENYFINTDNTNAINVVATAEDSTAKINIAGNDNIQNGNNKILISVTAENGDVRYYRIFVNCEEGTDET